MVLDLQHQVHDLDRIELEIGHQLGLFIQLPARFGEGLDESIKIGENILGAWHKKYWSSVDEPLF